MDNLNEQQVSKAIEIFANEYNTHKKGLFIMAPSGAGKTYYVNNQKEKHWIDGDKLWESSGAHPLRAWWLEGNDVITEIDKRSDKVTAKAKEKGLWIMGASNNWLKPDAIVIPDWDEHVRLIRHRETHNYDGGATSDRLEQVKNHREWILKWKEKGVPVFKTVSQAVNYLTNI